MKVYGNPKHDESQAYVEVKEVRLAKVQCDLIDGFHEWKDRNKKPAKNLAGSESLLLAIVSG